MESNVKNLKAFEEMSIAQAKTNLQTIITIFNTKATVEVENRINPIRTLIEQFNIAMSIANNLIAQYEREIERLNLEVAKAKK